MNEKYLLETAINEYVKYKEIVGNYRNFNTVFKYFEDNNVDLITDDNGQEYVELFFGACNMRVYNLDGRPLVENLFEVFGEDSEGEYITIYDNMTLAEAREILEGLQ